MKKRWMLAIILFLLVLTFAPAKVQAATPVGEAVSLTVYTMFDSSNILETNLTNLAYGTRVEFASSLHTDAGYEFVCWTVNGAVHPDMLEGSTFMVTNNLHLTARYKPAGSNAVVFMDTNGQIIDIKYTTIGTDIVAPDVSGITKPGYVLDPASNWNADFSNVTEDMFVSVQYVIDTAATFTLSVENGTDTTLVKKDNYNFNDVVTVTANEDTSNYYFQYWRIGDRIVSNEASFSFTMLENTVITAVYGGSALVATPMVTLSGALSIHSEYNSYLGQFFLPATYTYVEHGLVTSGSTENPTLDNDTQESGTKYNGATNEFLMSVLTSSSLYVRAYLVYKDNGGVLHTVYSEMQTPELFISEYGEGNSYYKWIEIYNPTSGTVDLANYSVDTSNSDPITLSGSLASGETFVICSSSATDPVLSASDLTSSNINFNGDDSVVLYHNGVIIDILGVIGVDPGSSWAVTSGSTEDHTLVRINGFTTPNANWNESEWVAYPMNYFDNIGIYGIPDVTSVSVSGTTPLYIGQSATFTATVNPGGTSPYVAWSSSNPSVATVNASTGSVTGVSAGTVNIIATSTQDGSTAGTYELTINARPNPTDIVISGSQQCIVGSTVSLSAVVNPEYSDQTVTWSSNNISVATVDESTGVVTGVSSGTATITATSTVNPEIIQTYEITVSYLVQFNSDGGTSVDSQYILENGFVSEPSDPSKANNTFLGWFLGDTEYIFTTPVTDSITLVAHWEESVSGTYATDLFISEYIEGSSNNKAIEIYNGTGNDINLSGYEIYISFNGGSSTATIKLSNVILHHNDVFVLANSSANATILAVTDQTSTSLSFNGDDAIVLRKTDGTVVDCIGKVGVDPGTEWGSGLTSTADNTIVRNASIISGDIITNDDFDPSVEWTGYATDTFTNLGTHTANVTP